MKDYLNQSKDSIRRDFAKIRCVGRERKQHSQNIRRVLEVLEGSSYRPYRKYIKGKLVRIIEPALSGNWVEFIHKEDSQALNKAAGWSAKEKYLFDLVRFDNE